MTREIITISYGGLPARLSTQYFNAQTAYFDYSADAPQPLVDHDISWQQGLDPNGRDRFTPRWICYDVRSGFAGLRTQDDPEDNDYEPEEAGNAALGAASSTDSTWTSKPEIVQTQVGTSSQHHNSRTTYRSLISREASGDSFNWDEEFEKQFAGDDDLDEDDNDSGVSRALGGRVDTTSTVQQASTKMAFSDAPQHFQSRERPWSHYLLFNAHPRCLVPVAGAGGLPLASMPSLYPASEAGPTESFESFEQGYARAKSWEHDNETFDTSLRRLLEAADRPQGFNVVLQSSDAWSGFSAWNLEQIVDEYPKLECLGWTVRSGKGVGELEAEQLGAASDTPEPSARDSHLARLRSMNRALSLLTSTETLSLLIPMALPSFSPRKGEDGPGWTEHLREDTKMSLQGCADSENRVTAAILASQLETMTLGARIRSTPLSLASLTAQLTWRGDTPIATLSGCLPTPILAPTAVSVPSDPIDILLSARGYHLQPVFRSQRVGPRESFSCIGAANIARAWISFSESSIVPQNLQLGCTFRSKHKVKTSKRADEPKPFALSAVARDSGGEAAAMITKNSVEEFIHGTKTDGSNPTSPMGLPEPLGRAFFAPLSFPVTSAFPRIWKGLSGQGRPSLSTSNSVTAGCPRSLPLISALSTTPASISHIIYAHRVLERALISHLPLAAWGLGGMANTSAGAAANEESEGRIGGRDGLKELKEKIEELRSAYSTDDAAGGQYGENEESGPGTDEEWEGEGGNDYDGLDWS